MGTPHLSDATRQMFFILSSVDLVNLEEK